MEKESISQKGMPKQYWEKKYEPSPAGKSTPSGSFDPKKPKDRPSTHNKVNQEDH